MSPADEVFILRQRLWDHGYRPLAVWNPDQRVNDKGEPLNSPGKQPQGRWREAATRDPPEAACAHPDPRALNTGLLCGEIVAFDVDVLDQELSDQIVNLIERKLGTTPLVRIGRAPKVLLVFRPERRLTKVQTHELFFPDGSKAKVELLAEGQQFVADGIHPDTGEPYTWTDGTPAEVRLDQLPVVCEEEAHAIIGEAEQLLRAAGGKPKRRPKSNNGPAGNFFSQVNFAALVDIAAWARSLFPRARFEPGTGAWRVSSKDLGRDLEEDISIHPQGIWDFGEEVALSAVDLVLRQGSLKTPIEAALWLCQRLRIEPEALGYTPSQASKNGVTLDDFYAYMPMHNYIYTPSRETWPGGSINARIPPVKIGLDEENQPIFIKASTWLDQNRPVEQMTWAPGFPTLIKNRLVAEGGWIERNGVSCFNLYRPPGIKPGVAALAGRWVAHVRKVFPDEADHIISWLAHRVQRPQEKINHALVLAGRQGIGKDTILEPVKRAVGPWNFSEPSPTQLLGQFNGFAKAVILRISEARDLGDVDRYQFYEHLKVYCAAPPDTLRVNEKHLREYNIFNCCGVIITTNYKTDGIYLPADDRRHYVAWSNLAKEDFEKEYWDQLWASYDDGGDRHVAAYLAQLDLSGFNPKAPPPKTEAFWEIVDAHRSSEDAEIADTVEELGNPPALTITNLIYKAVSTDLADWLKDRKNRRIIPHRLETCGYVPIRNGDAKDGMWKIAGRRQAIYAKTSLTRRDQLTAAEKLTK